MRKFILVFAKANDKHMSKMVKSEDVEEWYCSGHKEEQYCVMIEMKGNAICHRLSKYYDTMELAIEQMLILEKYYFGES